MDPVAVSHLPPARQVLYAGMDGLDDPDLIFENAEKIADALKPDPVLGYLYAHARAPRLWREAWAREAQVGSAIETLMADFFLKGGLNLESLFDRAGRAEAVQAMSSPRGVVALSFQGGFLTLLRQFVPRFLEHAVLIENKSRPNIRSLGANNPGAALFGALRTLGEGGTVCVAPDGPFGKPKSRIEVLGASCPITDGAAFLAYEADSETVWCAIRRDGRVFVPVAEPGPSRWPGETFEEFRSRLVSFYRDKIEEHLTENPQSLALTKVWRDRLRPAMERRTPMMPPAPLRHITPKRQRLYARLRRPDDPNLLVENAEKAAAAFGPDPVLEYLYSRIPAPKAPCEVWMRQAVVATCFEYLLGDYFARQSPSQVRDIFDPAARDAAIQAMTSPRGMLAMAYHSGFATMLIHFVVEFLDGSLVIDSGTRPMYRSVGADKPSAALFAALCALREGRSVYVAPDGGFGKPSGNIEVLGASVPIFDGAPFLAYESGCDTVWYSLRRNGRFLAPVVEPGPSRAQGETFKEFRTRMIEFYRGKVEEQLTGDPENLVLHKAWRWAMMKAIEEQAGGDERSRDGASARLGS